MTFTLHVGPQQGRADLHTYPNTVTVKSVEDLWEATRTDHTPGDFGGKNRSTEAFAGADCILGDIDNANRLEEFWIDLDAIKTIFKDYAFAAAPSRNHLKVKDGEAARPKYHLYFPVPFNTDAAKQERHMALLHERFEEVGFDPAVKDPARCFFGHSNQPIEAFWFQDGQPITSAFKGRPKGTGKPKLIPWRDLSLEELAENPEVVPAGERYKAHTALALYWANKGLSADEIEAKLIEFNAKMAEPRAMHTRKVQLQTRKLAESAEEKVNAEGGPRSEATFNRLRNYRVVKTEDGPVKVPVQTTSEEMRAAMRFFVALTDKAGQRTLTLRDNPQVLVTKPADLRDALERAGYTWDVRNIPGAMTKEDILVAFRNRSETITRMTCVPEHDMQPGTLFVPQISFPEASSTGALRQFLEVFSFKTIQDQYRFAAGLLSLYLNATFDGKIPLFALLAEAQNAGKTTVVRTAIRLLTGMDPIEQKGGRFNQADDHAQFSGVLGLAARGVLYDNLTGLSSESETEIARAVTDRDRSAWMMGVSRTHIRNSYVYFATFNDSEGFGRDIQERLIAIRMTDPADVDRDRRSAIMDALASWTERRDDVIADVRYLVGLTGRLGADETNPMEKYPEWTRRIAPALRAMYPKVACFDFLPSRDDHRINPDAAVLMDFAERLFVDNADDAVRDIKGGWHLAYGAVNLFERFALFSPDAARSYSLQQFTRMVGQSSRDLGDIRMIKRKGHGKVVYEFHVDDAVFHELRASGKAATSMF